MKNLSKVQLFIGYTIGKFRGEKNLVGMYKKNSS